MPNQTVRSAATKTWNTTAAASGSSRLAYQLLPPEICTTPRSVVPSHSAPPPLPAPATLRTAGAPAGARLTAAPPWKRAAAAALNTSTEPS